MEHKPPLRLYLKEEFQSKTPDFVTEMHIRDAMNLIEKGYFLDKFGALPNSSAVSYPLQFITVTNDVFEKVLNKLGFEALTMLSTPYKIDSSYVSGQWVSKNGRFFSSITTEPGFIFYEFSAPEQEEVEDLITNFNKSVNKRINRRAFEYSTGMFAFITKRGAEKHSASWVGMRDTIDNNIAERIEKVILPFFDMADAMEDAGVPPRLGVLMTGKPGTGKTYTIKTLVREFLGKVTIAHLAGESFVNNVSIRGMFEFLKKFSPVMVIMEDIEFITGNRYEIHSAVVQSLLDIMDGVVTKLDKFMLIATTNLPDRIDPAFMRPGRFDEILNFAPPASKFAANVLSGYFSKGNFSLSEWIIPKVAESGLTYAELRFVANELIRRAIVAKSKSILVSPNETDKICTLAKRGAHPDRPVGFHARLSEAQSAEPPTVGLPPSPFDMGAPYP